MLLLCLCILVATSKKQCKSGANVYHHNATWNVECNTCNCYDGVVKCTQVYCGNLNCFQLKKSNSCNCKPVHNLDCITPPCDKYGECGSEPMSVSNGGCSPHTADSKLTTDCSKVSINFERSKLPKVLC